MWRAIFRVGSLLKNLRSAKGIGSGGKILSKGKGYWQKGVNWAKNFFSGKNATNTGSQLSTVVERTIGSFNPKRASVLTKSNLFRNLYRRFGNVVRSKSFRNLLLVEGGFMAIDYLIEQGMSREDATAFVNELKETNFVFEELNSPYDVDSSDDLRSYTLTKLERKLSALTNFRVVGDDESQRRNIDDLYDDTERDIIIGKLVGALQDVVDSDSIHTSEEEEAGVRLAVVRAILHGSHYNPRRDRSLTHRDERELGHDTALSNLILADTEIIQSYGNAILSDYDNWFDFDDVDKDDEYYSRIALLAAIAEGAPKSIFADLDVEMDDVHEIEIIKDIEKQMSNRAYRNSLLYKVRR